MGYVASEDTRPLEDIDVVGSRALPNVASAIGLDASLPWESWPEVVRGKAGSFSIVYCSCVTHISPWKVTEGIVAGAGQALCPGGQLIIYGPFKKNGGFTTQSNADFDASLRSRDPQWGYRDVAEIEAVASS